jgi:3',5'-cyclic AMP phosphodiesterase CpdA
MQIIHISDTHIGVGNNLARFNAVIDDIISFGDPSNTTIIHTGDLVDVGSNKQALSDASDSLARIAASGRKVLLTPGNHDCGNALWISKSVADNFTSVMSKYIFPEDDHSFPTLTINQGVAMIGIQSSQQELNPLTRWMAEGQIGHKQLSKLNTMLDRPDVKQCHVIVYLHHQPFMGAFSVKPDVSDARYFTHMLNWDTTRFRRLKDAYSLVTVVRDRIDTMLCGHRHLGLDYSSEAKRYGFTTALDASSTVCYKTDDTVMRYRILDTQTNFYDIRYVSFPQ